jgi:hypothetical protein
VHADLDTLVIALYVTVDELLGPRQGPGRPPKLTDAELVCLAVAQVLVGVAPSAAGCGWPTSGWATCSPTCRPLGLQPSAAPRRPPGRLGPGRPGRSHPDLVRQLAAGGLHPAPVCRLAGDRQALGAGHTLRELGDHALVPAELPTAA